MAKLNITFDVDLTDYAAQASGSAERIDELEAVFWPIAQLLAPLPVQTTWYLRLDGQLESLYGAADFLFQTHPEKLAWLTEHGHRLGWHFHAYRPDPTAPTGWVQNTDEASVLAELTRYAPLAQRYGLQTVRMGWGYHTNATLALLDQWGFAEDSSAIPRPLYPWSQHQCDWTSTPAVPYQPSVQDYRVPGEPSLGIWEVPMTTLPVPAPYDTQEVIRYLNLAYHHDIFRQSLAAVDWQSLPVVTTITHPYELLPRVGGEPHGLLAFSLEVFERNLTYLLERSRADDADRYLHTL